MSAKPTAKLLKYFAGKTLEYNRLRAEAPPSRMEPGAMYISGIDPDDPKQVGLAKKLVQDVLDFNRRR